MGYSAYFWPIQFLAPAENGLEASFLSLVNLDLSVALSSSQRCGRNRLGSTKLSVDIEAAKALTWTYA